MESLKWEKEIAERVNNGDEDIFNEILTNYTSRLLTFIYNLVKDKETAEELTQEVFLRLWKKRKKYKPMAKFSTFLYRIASNLCIDYMRKKKGIPEIYSLDRPISDQNGKSMVNMEQDISLSSDNYQKEKEIKAKVNSALESLPDRQRIALTLKLYEERNYKEISDILGCSISAVETLLFRARQNLKKIFPH